MFTNISAYKFANLTDLKPLRESLLAQCKAWNLKGTILLSTEGINMFVAGPETEIDLLVAEVRSVPGLEDLRPKHSPSDHQPFTRMIVRIKKEIIAFGVEGINPAQRTSPKLPARTLKQWLDEGRAITLLDTRNDYEVKLGTFQGAKILNIDHFRKFPAAVDALPPELKDQPVVMFCTGGIRCEKAGPYMEREGFRNIYQLEGGILKYFEECGGEHYDGECFVFDQRVGVDPALRETNSSQCFVCQTPLDDDDQADPRYVESVSCPYCFKTDDQRVAETVAARNAAFQKLTDAQPGSQEYRNLRPLNVSEPYEGWALLDFLSAILPHTAREEWLRLCEEGRFVDGSDLVLSATDTLKAGRRIYHVLPATVEPEINADIHVLYEDEAIVVLDKPAPLPMHPSGRYNRNTLQYFLNEVYGQQKLRPAHRLDANTTGLVACARTRRYAGLLQPQFAQGRVAKTYLVAVQGRPAEDRFVCNFPIEAEPGELGSRGVDAENGLPAVTEFAVRGHLADGTTLLEAWPRTGRTNQIRVHLWQMGLPVVGDPAYLPDRKLGEAMTLLPGDAPLRLHAWKLEFQHPLTGKPVSFESEAPAWAR